MRHLLDHYRWFGALLDPGCIDVLCSGRHLELARLPGRNESCFRLYLANSASARTPREGESAICLTRAKDPNPLRRLIFSLVSVDGRLALAIGGLKGPSRGGKQAVIDATRDLYGLRPKDATLLAARAFAQALGAAEVHAASDTLHVHRVLPDNPKLCSYDSSWRERGALVSDRYGFVFRPIAACKGAPNARERTKLAIMDGVRGFEPKNTCPSADYSLCSLSPFVQERGPIGIRNARRGAMSPPTYLLFGPAIETPRPDEDETIRAIVASIERTSETSAKAHGHGIRQQHAKGHGLVRGELAVYGDLPPHLRQGLFSGNRYDAPTSLA